MIPVDQLSKRLNFKGMLTGSASAKLNFDHDEKKKKFSFLFESQSCLSKEALEGQEREMVFWLNPSHEV
jgi:hypothetical protein